MQPTLAVGGKSIDNLREKHLVGNIRFRPCNNSFSLTTVGELKGNKPPYLPEVLFIFG